MEIEYDQSMHIKSLEKLVARYEKELSDGDESVIVKRAWAIAFLKFVQAGHRVMDLPWFDHLKDSTGKIKDSTGKRDENLDNDLDYELDKAA